MAIQLLVTDEDLAVLGDPLSGWTNLDVTIRFNEPASGFVDLPARADVIEQLQPGHRLVVIRDKAIWCAGPLEIPQDFAWGIGENGEAPPGRVRVNFTDDLGRIAGYITWPDPAAAWTAQPAHTYRLFHSTNTETTVRTVVDETCGPGALAARQIPHLVLDPAAGIGATWSAKTRFEPVLAFCRRVSVWGGMGFRTRQVGDEIRFGCYQPADLTATARFSAGLGNLRALTYKLSAPTGTHALVAGTETEGSPTRTFVERANAAAAADWWRVEKYIDGGADTDADGELTADGDAALAEDGPTVELATVTVDTEDLRAGVHYGLGDRVTVALPTGLEIAEVVRSIHLQATPTTGEYVTSLIGSAEATSDPQVLKQLHALSRRLGRLETR
ncbi:hypothetical protein [Streptomyces sp. NPDC006997]|uniref:Gp37-like protein n=1 Tax=Streptomyces sp. NPDC006997 TaxID=3155356 RepID=UPI0033C2E8F7